MEEKLNKQINKSKKANKIEEYLALVDHHSVTEIL